MKKLKKVRLISGEEVLLGESVLESDQVYVRMNENLIAGIIYHGPDRCLGCFSPAVYIWTRIGKVYRYAGDIAFHRDETGKVFPSPSLFRGPRENDE